MGRRSKNKTNEEPIVEKRKKNSKNKVDEDEENIEFDAQDNIELNQIAETSHLNLIENIRKQMIEYSEIECIPLCDYLEHDFINSFIKFLSHDTE